MPFVAGKEPSEGGSFIKTKELPQLTSSGLFLVQIANAMYYKGESKDGKSYEQCRLDCGVMYQGKAVKACSFSFFLPSHDMEAVCYFLNLRNAEGYLCLPDPEHKEGVSQNGNNYSLDTFTCLQNQLVHVCLEFTGTAVSQNGTQYSTFKLKGFCDANGATAVEACHNKPAHALVEFINQARARRPQPQTQTQAQPVYGQQSNYQTQQSAPQNTGYVPTVQPSGIKPRFDEQGRPLAQPQEPTFIPDNIPF